MLKNTTILICSLFIASANAQSINDTRENTQIDESFQENRNGKFYMIPEFSFWLGTYSLVEVAPQLAYHLTDRLSFGLGPHYVYHKNVDYYTRELTKTHMWGLKTFGRFTLIKDAASALPIYIFDEMFAHLEYEKMRVDSDFILNSPSNSFMWIDMLYVGLGINQRAGRFNSYSVMLLWNLNNSFSSLYSNPSYRVGMNLYF